MNSNPENLDPQKHTLRFTQATPNTLIELYKNLDLDFMNDLMKNLLDGPKEKSNEL